MPRHAFVIFAGRTRYQVQRVMPFDPSILQLFITFLLISPSLSFLQQTRVTVPTFAVELMIIPFLLISLLSTSLSRHFDEVCHDIGPKPRPTMTYTCNSAVFGGIGVAECKTPVVSFW